VAVGLFILCVFVVPYMLVGESVHQFFSTISLFGGDQFRVPGELTLELEKPGKYVIWSETSTFFEGRRHLFPDEIPPGMSVMVMDEKSGQALQVSEAMGSTERVGNNSRFSILSFEIHHAGTYTVIVENLDPERVFLIRPSLIGHVVDFVVSTGKRLIASGLCFLFGLIVAPLLSIVIEVRRQRNRKDREKLLHPLL